MAGNDLGDASRRTVLKGTAVGAGALLGAAGLTATSSAAAEPATVSPHAISSDAPDAYFLKLDGITGENTAYKLMGYIQLADFSFGVSRAAANGKTRAKTATPGQIHFHAPTSMASPLLMLHTISGAPIKTGHLTVVRKGAETAQFLKVDLTDVVISSYSDTAPATDIPTDTASLSFGKIVFSYYPANPKGGITQPVTVSWDTRTDKYS